MVHSVAAWLPVVVLFLHVEGENRAPMVVLRLLARLRSMLVHAQCNSKALHGSGATPTLLDVWLAM